MSESTIVMTKSSNKLDPAIKKKAFAFLEKLAEDDSAPGLHVEPIVNSMDKRVRTGRVDQGYRAVLFKLTESGTNTYVFHGVWPHDDAIKVAGKTVLTVNPVNGIAELRVVEPEAQVPEPWAGPAPETSAAPEAVDSAPLEDQPAPDAEPTWAFPVGRADLVDVLGVPAEIADTIGGLTSEDALLEYATALPGWLGQVLLDLATGLSVEQVKEQLQIEQSMSTDGTDAEILAGLRHPAARMEFAEMDGVEELRRVIEGGDFSGSSQK